MNPWNNQDNESQRREQERELAIRMRQLEAEVNPPPVKSPRTQSGGQMTSAPWGTLIKVGQFLAIALVILILFRVATAIAGLILVGAILWVGYKIFIERDRP